MRSPTARTLQTLRDLGYTAEVVERWLPYAKVRKDFLGVIDVLAVKDGERGVLGVQATTTSNQTSRMAKALASDTLRVWLRAGNRFEVWGWAKRGSRGERKIWTLDRRLANG